MQGTKEVQNGVMALRLPELMVENEINYKDVELSEKVYYKAGIDVARDTLCQFCGFFMVQPISFTCSHRCCKDCFKTYVEKGNVSKCNTCGHGINRIKSQWENPLFEFIDIQFNRQIDRGFQEVLYRAFRDKWNNRVRELPNANYDFKNYLQEKDAYIKFKFQMQLT